MFPKGMMISGEKGYGIPMYLMAIDIGLILAIVLLVQGGQHPCTDLFLSAHHQRRHHSLVDHQTTHQKKGYHLNNRQCPEKILKSKKRRKKRFRRLL